VSEFATWAQLIRKVQEADPLECPKCKGPMRVIALIDDPCAVQRILEHFGRGAPEPAKRGPPRQAPDWPRNALNRRQTAASGRTRENSRIELDLRELAWVNLEANAVENRAHRRGLGPYGSIVSQEKCLSWRQVGRAVNNR
jgi:hypothetical protein